MGKQIFDRTKKILGALLAMFFILMLTVTSAIAADSNENGKCQNGVCQVSECHDGICNLRSAATVTVGEALKTVALGTTAAIGGSNSSSTTK